MCVIDPHKLVITQPFFNIFSWNFQNRFRIEKNPYCGKRILDLGKNIEKWLSYNEFVGIDYAHVANWDMGDLVLFLRLFDHIIHS